MIDVKCIPDALKEGENWPLMDIDPEWLWVSRNSEDQIVGFLLAAPCHGLVLIWRVKILPSASPAALLRLFRQFIKDIRRRGALGYIAMVDVLRPEEQTLARIAFRAKGMLAPGTFALIAGTVNTGHLGDSICP